MCSVVMAFSLIRLSCPHILCSARDIVINVQFMCAYSTPEHINNLLFSCLKWPHDRNYHLSYRTAIRPTRISYILVCKCVPVCVVDSICLHCLLASSHSIVQFIVTYWASEFLVCILLLWYLNVFWNISRYDCVAIRNAPYFITGILRERQ